MARNRSGGSAVGSQGDVSLEEVGVSRAAEEGDQLPKYTRVGDPGEVPPGYTPENNAVVGNQVEAGNVESNAQPGVVDSAPATVVSGRRSRWMFW